MRTKVLILIIAILSLVIIIASILSGKNKSSARSATGEISGFTRINSIEGVSFYVNSVFTDSATAITQISDNVEISKNQFYSYKNGTDKYLLFNMSQLVIAAQKGTDFGIGASNDKEYSLQSSNIMNIWFTRGSKKFESETSGNTTITTANAGVTINSTVYGDFCGKLANINIDGEEWSLFVGVPGERYDKLSDNARKGIENIISTFAIDDNAELLSQDVYAVSISGNDNNKQAVETEEVDTGTDESISLSQTAIVDKDEDMAYSSSPYNMLSLNDNGILSALNDHELIYEEPIVKPVKVYRGNEAIDIIKKFCSQKGTYAYADAPDGSAWEVVEYQLNYKNCLRPDYVNVRICGLDGEKLRYRGLKYSFRTYDASTATVQEGDWITRMYAYYPVPNGCSEYCLLFGDTTSMVQGFDDVHGAYYHIDNSVQEIIPEPEPTENESEEGNPTDAETEDTTEATDTADE